MWRVLIEQVPIEHVPIEHVQLESATLVQYYFTLIGKIIHIGYQ